MCLRAPLKQIEEAPASLGLSLEPKAGPHIITAFVTMSVQAGVKEPLSSSQFVEAPNVADPEAKKHVDTPHKSYLRVGGQNSYLH